MRSPVQSIVTWAYRRRLTVVGASLLLVALSWIGLRRITFDANVLSLLPRDGVAIPAFRTFVERFGSFDQLLIVCGAPDGHSVTEYADDVDRWVDSLRRAPEIEWVDAGTAGPDRDWGWLADHQLLLLRGRSLDTALSRLQPDGMARELASTRQLAAVPSPAVAALVRQDPLDLLGLLREQLGGQRAGIAVGITEGGYVTPDGRHRLIIAKPKHPPYDTGFSRALMTRLDTIAAGQQRPRGSGAAAGDDADDERPPLEVTYAGGHRIALETEALVRQESVLNSVSSLVLILPLLFLVFRSVWLLLCGAIPSTASLVVVLGLMGLAGATLSAAATGAAAMLFGLGVDGVVLVYVAHRLALADGMSADASIEQLGSPSASMLLGMFTTAATFYGLVFVDFPSLQQLGLIIGHSMVACGVLTLVLVPAMLPKRRPAGPIRTLTWPRLAAWVTRRWRPILIVSALVTIALGAAAFRLRVNTSLERMRSTTPGAIYEETVQRLFGLPTDVYVLVQQGAALEPLLVDNETLIGRIRGDMPSLAIDAPSALLASDAAQQRARARVRAGAPAAAAAQAALAKAARATGFRDGTLDPFRDRLPALLDPEPLTYDGYHAHRLGDLIDHFIVGRPGAWTLASYAYPASAGEAARFERLVNENGTGRLTGLPLVNRELAARFIPQFLRGLVIGSVIVVILIVWTFRTWRLSMLAVTPTVVGLIWTAGLLAIAGVVMDLFALFAVVTFVGIGVDYGIHVVHRYRDHGNAEAAIAQLAPVIVVAGLITLLGYGTLVTSSYPPLRSIGIVSAVSVLALVAASIVVLPALLIGGRGR